MPEDLDQHYRQNDNMQWSDTMHAASQIMRIGVTTRNLDPNIDVTRIEEHQKNYRTVMRNMGDYTTVDKVPGELRYMWKMIKKCEQDGTYLCFTKITFTTRYPMPRKFRFAVESAVNSVCSEMYEHIKLRVGEDFATGLSPGHLVNLQFKTHLQELIKISQRTETPQYLAEALGLYLTGQILDNIKARNFEVLIPQEQ